MTGVSDATEQQIKRFDREILRLFAVPSLVTMSRQELAIRRLLAPEEFSDEWWRVRGVEWSRHV